jgi:hypothetical protein
MYLTRFGKSKRPKALELIATAAQPLFPTRPAEGPCQERLSKSAVYLERICRLSDSDKRPLGWLVVLFQHLAKCPALALAPFLPEGDGALAAGVNRKTSIDKGLLIFLPARTKPCVRGRIS